MSSSSPSARATTAVCDRTTATTARASTSWRRATTTGHQGITTTDVNLRGKGYSSGAYCDDFGGTSSATPLVAGIAALVLSANKTLKWTAVRDILRSSADKIDKTHGRYEDGYSIRYGFGRVNAEAAVSSAQRRKGARKRRAGKKR